MPEERSITCRETVEITAATSLITCIPAIIFNIWITNRIEKKRGRQHFARYKGAIFWDLISRFPYSGTFAAQVFLEQKIIKLSSKDNLTLHEKAAISALSGWLVAMTEIILFYPLDSMRVVMQTHPELFKRLGIPYFLKNQYSLRRGLGISLLRSTLTNSVAWPIKTITQDHLLETTLHQDAQSILAAFIFTFSRTIIGHPLDLMRLVIQCHCASHPSEKVTFRKTASLIKDRIQREGLRFLTTGLGPRTLFAFFATSVQLSVVQRYMGAKQSPPCSRS